MVESEVLDQGGDVVRHQLEAERPVDKAYPKTHVIGIPGRVPYQLLKNSTNTGARTSGAVIATEWS